MSSSVTVIGGVNNGTISGAVTVPEGGLSSSGALSSLQATLGAYATSILGGTAGLTNVDTITGVTYSTSVSGAPSLLEVTNTDSVGTSTSGSVSGVIGVSSVYSAVVIQAPGTFTVNGSGSSTEYVLGSSSNVDLFTNGGTNTIVGATSSDTINALSGSSNVTYTTGSNELVVGTGTDTVFATGNASVYAVVGRGYAGKIEFTNEGTNSSVVNGNAGSATAFGGAGGGSFLGGSAGSNSLIGGNGSVTLVGGGNDDTLSAGANGATTSFGSNYLFAGAGNETLLASSVTGSNLFKVGLGSDVISTAGSGTQYIFGSSGNASITGSTTSGSNNVYFFGAATGAGGNDIITNFNNTNSELIATNGAKIESITSASLNGTSGALVTLSDGTHITLSNVNAASIQGSQGGTVIT